jgi:O-antigen ligase
LNRAAAKILALAGYGAFCAWFYYRYVPLVFGYQAVLAPALLYLAVRTATDENKGLLAFTFIFPLINVWPYFFGLGEGLPLAPAALTAFLAYFGGRMAGQIRKAGSGAEAPGVMRSLPLELKLLAAWGAVSGLLTFLRYMDFFPFAASGIHETQINVAGVTAGGARMSVVFTSASLLAGIAMFGIYRRAVADKALRRRLLGVLSLSAGLGFVFGYLQKLWTVAPGNTSYWNNLGQINATFKDPNSLAAFIAGFVPLLLALAVSERGWKRLPLAAAGVMGLGLLPLAGSRSGMAAVGVGAAMFLAEAFGRSRRAVRRRAAAAAGLLVLLFVVWNVAVVKDSSLAERIGWSLYQLKEETAPGDFFNHRLTLWAGARAFFRGAPLTGIGLGAFIVEFPDYVKERNVQTIPFADTALNLGFQIAAETGLIGLMLTSLFGLGLIGRMGRVIRGAVGANPEPGGASRPRDWIRIGAVAGLAAFFFNFLFHTYTASFEVQFLFWFLAAIVCADSGQGPRRESAAGKAAAGAWIPRAAAGVLLVGGAVYLALCLGPLSIGARAEKYGWNREFGFHAEETDPEVRAFRWTKGEAGFEWPVNRLLELTVRALNPDLERDPLIVWLYRADRRFRKVEQAGSIVLRDTTWQKWAIEVPGAAAGEQTTYWVIEPERTWNPNRALGVADRRTLGVGVALNR